MRKIGIEASAGALAVAACIATAAVAAEEAQVRAGLAAWRNSGCSECHGAFANGEKERDEAPTGANLRTTRLDDATIAETIRCGRPGAGMPSFSEDAYAKGCYGQPPGPAPDDLTPAPATLKTTDIAAIVAYLRARIIGRGAVTPQECAAYYGENAKAFCP
jgi:mono/diheme cytochrome c family protein